MISRRTFTFYSFRYFKTVFRSHFAGALFSFAKAADVEPLRPVNIVDRGVKRTAAEDLALNQRGALHKGVENMFAQKGKARCLKARIWDDVSRVVSGKVTEIGVSLARSHLLRQFLLSSPRAKCAGPKGLRAESAGAFTGRRNSHSGRGEDFLTGQPDFFTETAVTPERKVEKSLPRWEINRHAEG